MRRDWRANHLLFQAGAYQDQSIGFATDLTFWSSEVSYLNIGLGARIRNDFGFTKGSITLLFDPATFVYPLKGPQDQSGLNPGGRLLLQQNLSNRISFSTSLGFAKVNRLTSNKLPGQYNEGDQTNPTWFAQLKAGARVQITKNTFARFDGTLSKLNFDYATKDPDGNTGPTLSSQTLERVFELKFGFSN